MPAYQRCPSGRQDGVSKAGQCDAAPALMKAIQYKASRRTRRETFPDGSQLVRRPGGGYEIIEARPKYGVCTLKAKRKGENDQDECLGEALEIPPVESAETAILVQIVKDFKKNRLI